MIIHHNMVHFYSSRDPVFANCARLEPKLNHTSVIRQAGLQFHLGSRQTWVPPIGRPNTRSISFDVRSATVNRSHSWILVSYVYNLLLKNPESDSQQYWICCCRETLHSHDCVHNMVFPNCMDSPLKLLSICKYYLYKPDLHCLHFINFSFFSFCYFWLICYFWYVANNFFKEVFKQWLLKLCLYVNSEYDVNTMQ